MKNTIYITVLLILATVSGIEKENIKIEPINKCIDCDEVSKQLQDLNNSFAVENSNKVKKTVQKVKVLDSTNKKIKKELTVVKSELKEVKIDLSFSEKKNSFLKNRLKEKPKEIIIRDTIKITEKKSFWGTKKIDTIK